MLDDLGTLLGRAEAEATQRASEDRQFAAKKAKRGRAMDLLAQLKHPSQCPLAEMGFEPAPGDVHDWYAGVLCDFIESARDVDPEISLPAPETDGTAERLAHEITRVAWSGGKNAVKSILDQIFDSAPKLATSVIHAMMELCDGLIGIGQATPPPGPAAAAATAAMPEDEAPARREAPQRKRRGRPTDTDPKVDKRIYDAWNTRQYKTYEELAVAFKTSKRKVSLAIGRERKRRNK